MGLFASKRNTEPLEEGDLGQVRSRARRRLIGAAILLAVGIVGFPLLFETQPRSGSAQAPSIATRKDTAGDAANLPKIVEKSTTQTPASPPAKVGSEAPVPALAEPATSVERGTASGGSAAASGGSISGGTSASGSVTAVAAATAATAAAAAAATVAAAPKPAETTQQPPAAKPAVAAVKPPAAAAVEPKPVAVAANPTANAKPAGSDRFVVQVGAFVQDAGVRQARTKLESAGLRSYTQVIKTPEGKRTRVRAGPYATREDAERAAAKARAAGLSPSIVPLD